MSYGAGLGVMGLWPKGNVGEIRRFGGRGGGVSYTFTSTEQFQCAPSHQHRNALALIKSQSKRLTFIHLPFNLPLHIMPIFHQCSFAVSHPSHFSRSSSKVSPIHPSAPLRIPFLALPPCLSALPQPNPATQHPAKPQLAVSLPPSVSLRRVRVRTLPNHPQEGVKRKWVWCVPPAKKPLPRLPKELF